MPVSSRTQALALVGIVLLCTGLAGIDYHELAEPSAGMSDARATPATAAVLPAPSADAPFSLPSVSSFAEIVDRPLLSPSRRPAPEVRTAGQDTHFIVAGIIVSPSLRSAVVTHGTPPIVSRVVEGQKIDGWTVRSILSDHIVLERGTAQAEIKLVDKSVASPPPRPAPPRRNGQD